MFKNIKPKSKSYVIILIAILCVNILLYIYFNFENFENSISFYKWWGKPGDVENTTFNNIFSVMDDKNIRVHNVFNVHNDNIDTVDKHVINVQFSGESYYDDPNLFDLNLIPTSESSNVISFPFAYFHLLSNNIDVNIFTQPRNITVDEIKNKKFCLFSVSNPANEVRNEFFHKLSKYKKVDSCGKYLNNVGYDCPGSYASSEYRDYISKYKFMICFENKSMDHYFTEKLLNSYMNGTIPIYWGCSNLDHYNINMNAILYLKPNFTEDDVNELVEKIKKLDQDDSAYLSYYKNPLFHKIPDEFNLEKIQEKISNILK
jgi:hypothetical protein